MKTTVYESTCCLKIPQKITSFQILQTLHKILLHNVSCITVKCEHGKHTVPLYNTFNTCMKKSKCASHIPKDTFGIQL